MLSTLKEKISNKEAKVAIIGLGYVGLPLAVAFSAKGFETIGFDVSAKKINTLNKGKSDIADISDENLQEQLATNFSVTADMDAIVQADAVIICVPTPLTETMEPDMSYISNAMDMISQKVKKGVLISLESTTYPGTTREFICKTMAERGFTLGKDFFACYSPERVDPGNKTYNTLNTPKVVGGVDVFSKDLGVQLYEQVIQEIVPVNSAEVAEMSKLLENTFRSINIAFINEMALLAEKMDIDIWETIEAASSKPFGFMKFTPGPGIGGHCIPLDPMYLSWKARSKNFYSRFIELAHETNRLMPEKMIEHAALALNKHQKAINGSKILLVGMAYKENSNDLRESPSLYVYELLKQQGAKVDFCDPEANVFSDQNGDKQYSIDLEYNSFQKYDLVLLLTGHDVFDMQAIGKNSQLILDTKNMLAEQFDVKKVTYGKNNKGVQIAYE
ncbi:nucleotide sugar dehydrogenase family protein [Listeria fleischmannii 1991]|uniref:UDP-glucose 6-dehydrogenase tuaD n=2 Tax=Listeria fleischmannii TaxID=1069827 RepID=A0A2X3HCJ5_9LIST|nr:nucleotide sugar dehydrogenase [Listeria fleischmannii]EMG26700.1 putative NDP-sugar dehydrogenase [Listeria fleischmannii subsp. fleischmannii LU2006-1]KMT61435.1 nucleotide sugar dehydrogenase family protein [Listeria fleischmannii 1991]SQC70403.1 UDP-glucose 6-dehydrogenase tuaD [Listeria fleischmannii subsp. fleischmannii]